MSIKDTSMQTQSLMKTDSPVKGQPLSKKKASIVPLAIAKREIKCKLDMYHRLTALQYYLPLYKSSIVKVRFLNDVREGECFLPKTTEVPRVKPQRIHPHLNKKQLFFQLYQK